MKPEVSKIVANLIINEIKPRLMKKGLDFDASPVKPHEVMIMGCLKYCEVFSHHEIRQMLDKAFE